ncbi:MAG: DUF6488 family protein [Sulfurimonas sp.]|nr:DUF6488 family protein [Sulfurimonas sp.]
MKKIVRTSLIIAVLTFSFNSLYAGANHNHDGQNHKGHTHAQEKVTKTFAKKEAIQKIKKLVKSKKIEKSWLKASDIDAKKKKFGKNLEWVFSFKNDKVKNTKKQVIYIFVNLYGEVTGANYTGK